VPDWEKAAFCRRANKDKSPLHHHREREGEREKERDGVMEKEREGTRTSQACSDTIFIVLSECMTSS